MQPALLLDKHYAPNLEADLGKIGIRVVVFSKKQAGSSQSGDDQPLDLESDEDFSTSDSEVNSYLELPKRGKLCCVFLINGQRHHGLDNAFIVNDLKMKYLRKRMIVIVDLDGLSPKAHAEIIQGSRSGFYEGQVYHKIQGRLIATLQSDPDLLELEEEAAEELSQLGTGNAAVQQALDQLIEHHFDFGDHSTEGGGESGGKEGHFFGADGKPVNVDVVTFGEDGAPALGPVLVSNHAAETLRLPPNTKSKLTITVAPNSGWSDITNIGAFIDPVSTGLNCVFTKNNDNATVDLEFVEPPSFDQNEYPIESTLRILANFKDVAEPRLLEKIVVIRPRKKRPDPQPRKLTDTPTYIRIASRQPIRLIAGGPDSHVKVLWDGNDHLTFEPNPTWTFSSSCTSHANFSIPIFTKPANGRFEALIHTPEDTLVGTKLTFQLQAHGPNGQVLSVDFVAEVVAPPGPKKTAVKLPVRGQRRPPYQLRIVTEKDFGVSNTRWGEDAWDATHAGAFIEPKSDAPLTLCINQDFGLLKNYMDSLVSKKADEQRAEERKTKYISHVAYHLYQMYLAKDDLRKKKEAHVDDTNLRLPEDDEMQNEVNRVASTLIRLMDVTR